MMLVGFLLVFIFMFVLCLVFCCWVFAGVFFGVKKHIDDFCLVFINNLKITFRNKRTFASY